MTQHQKWEENEIREASKCAEHEAIARKEARIEGRRDILNLMRNLQQDIEKSDYPQDYKSGAFNLAVRVNVELYRIELEDNDKQHELRTGEEFEG